MLRDIIKKYIADVLNFQLVAMKIPDSRIENIASCIRTQMESCIYHWNDEKFRRSLLVTGEEEGAFYLPKAPSDILSFVVVTVRNSALESVHADSYQPPDQGRRLIPEDIRSITSEAIKYFSEVDFEEVLEKMNAPEDDLYGDLAKRYSASWKALSALSLIPSDMLVVEYSPVRFTAKPRLNNLRKQEQSEPIHYNESRLKC